MYARETQCVTANIISTLEFISKVNEMSEDESN